MMKRRRAVAVTVNNVDRDSLLSLGALKSVSNENL
jgi:hypothetical protein